MNKDKRNNIKLLGTLNNADESGIIANANQIYDANEDKSTQDVSKEHKERIETLETKESSMQTTLENITKTGEASAASNVTYNHNDSKLDATNVQQAVDEISTKTVFDISAYHATGGTLATYDNLEDALGTNGKNIPQSLRKGGMSVKFVQTSDNKYVQFRYMSSSTADSDFTNVANWQGVDDEPTAGSDNLVKSGGVYAKIKALEDAGYVFKGVATPETNPGTPNGLVFYLASESGTYTNFNAIELQDGLSALMWNGSWSIQQILSIDDVPTAESNNLVKSGGAKSYTDEKASEIYTFLKDIHPAFFKDSFIIADLAGNVAFEVDKKGNTTYVGKVTDVFSNYNKDKFIIADKNGYVVAKFENGGASIAFKNPTNFLERKVFYTLGDSLSAANKYQLKLAEITGAVFDVEANIDDTKPISVGGTTTMGANATSGFQRARNLVSLAGNKDVVIIENINDMNHVSYGGDINSAPYTEYPDGTNNGATKTLYGAYKWLCEYLITNLPSTQLFWMIPNRIAVNYSSPETRPDGTINMDYYTSTQAHEQYMQLVAIQKEVAAYYGIPVLNMIEESGINYINGGTFFNDSNVHPKDVGYYRWGETIARLLVSK